jgi:cardiolipin synthase
MAVPSSGPSTSRRWLQPRIRRDDLHRMAPLPARIRIGASDAWDKARSFIRHWLAWLLLAFLLEALGHRWSALLPLAVAFVFYLTQPRAHPAVYPIDARIDTDSPEFFVTLGGATGSPVVPGNAVRLFQNGDEFYPAMLEDIERARRSVTMEQYIFWDGQVGRRFAEAFAERAAADVEVKLLVDAIGSATLGEENLRILEAGGVHLAYYHPIHWYTLSRANHRTHRKSIVIDGRIAYTGGAGLADHWLGNADSPAEWRDMMVRVEGPAALVQQSGFAQNWLTTTGEILSGAAFFPVPEAAGPTRVQTILSSPTSGAGAAATMYLLALQCAKRSIHIANPYFIPSSAVIELLARAVRRGVRVRLLLAGRHNDTWWARQNSLRLYGPLLDAGVHVFEFLPTMLHCKTMVIDGVWATIGTANFDNRSFALNEETNVCLDDPTLVAQLEAAFTSDLHHAHQIHRMTWKRRGLPQRLRELTASLIQDQV